jgi:hypothetical protein
VRRNFGGLSNRCLRACAFADERLKKSVKVFVDSVAAVRCWREVGHELGLTPEELEAIGGPAPDPRKSQTKSKTVVVDGRSPQVRGYAEKMLNKWIEHNGEYTSVEQLIAALKKRKLNDIAGKRELIGARAPVAYRRLARQRIRQRHCDDVNVFRRAQTRARSARGIARDC